MTEKLTFKEYLHATGGTIVLHSIKDDRGINHLGCVSFNRNLISWIESDVRGKGYGSLLLKEAESHIKRNGWSSVMLTPIKDYEGFYIKNGYRRGTILDMIWYMQFSGTFIKKI